jgi:hypothetical protein
MKIGSYVNHPTRDKTIAASMIATVGWQLLQIEGVE